MSTYAASLILFSQFLFLRYMPPCVVYFSNLFLAKMYVIQFFNVSIKFCPINISSYRVLLIFGLYNLLSDLVESCCYNKNKRRVSNSILGNPGINLTPPWVFLTNNGSKLLGCVEHKLFSHLERSLFRIVFFLWTYKLMWA